MVKKEKETQKNGVFIKSSPRNIKKKIDSIEVRKEIQDIIGKSGDKLKEGTSKIIGETEKIIKEIEIPGIFTLIYFVAMAITIIGVLITVNTIANYLISMSFSAVPIGYLLCSIVVLLIVSSYLHKKVRKSFFVVFIILCLLISSYFIVPFAFIGVTINESDQQFEACFGENWNEFDTDVSDKFLKKQFILSETYLGFPEPDNYIVQSNISYVNTPEYQLYYDIYYPKTLVPEIGNNRTVILIHGGSWLTGTRENIYILKHLASQGYVCFSIDYRLTDLKYLKFSNNFQEALEGFTIAEGYRVGNYGIRDMIEDIGNFTHFIVDNNDKYGADLNNVTIIGQSAGAYLAGITAFGYNNPWFGTNFCQSIKITNTVLYFPPNNASEYFYHLHDFYNNPPTFEMIEGTPETNPDAYFHYTPSNLINESSPPCLIFQGTTDSLVPIENSEAIHQVMNNNPQGDNQCILVKSYFVGHAFDNSNPFQSMTLYYLERFLFNVHH